MTKRGEVRPGDRDANRTVDASVLAKMLMAWHCQRPNIAYNERKLFDEYYKTLFRTGYDPASILALHAWLTAIDEAWRNLVLNDVLKAGRAYVKFHVLYSVSAIIAQANKQASAVVQPSFTLKAAGNASEVLPLSANCVDKALESALGVAQSGGKIFSPQNWLKSNASVQGENLVAGTIASMLSGFPNGKTILELLKVPADAFAPRWSAE